MQPDSFDAANHLSRLYPTEDLAFLRQPGLSRMREAAEDYLLPLSGLSSLSSHFPNAPLYSETFPPHATLPVNTFPHSPAVFNQFAAFEAPNRSFMSRCDNAFRNFVVNVPPPYESPGTPIDTIVQGPLLHHHHQVSDFTAALERTSAVALSGRKRKPAIIHACPHCEMVFNSAVKLDKHVLAVHLVLPDGAFVKKEIPNRRTQETSLHKQQQQAGVGNSVGGLSSIGGSNLPSAIGHFSVPNFSAPVSSLDDPAALALDLFQQNDAKEMEQLQKINEIIAAAGANLSSWMHQRRENASVPLFTFMPSSSAAAAAGNMSLETLADLFAGSLDQDNFPSLPSENLPLTRKQDEKLALKQYFLQDIATCDPQQLCSEVIYLGQDSKTSSSDEIQDKVVQSLFSIDDQYLLPWDSESKEAQVEFPNQDSKESSHTPIKFDVERYKRWLKRNLDKNPACFNLFGLDTDDFHDILTQSYPENVSSEESDEKENGANEADSNSKKYIYDLDRNRLVKKRRRKSKKLAGTGYPAIAAGLGEPGNQDLLVCRNEGFNPPLSNQEFLSCYASLAAGINEPEVMRVPVVQQNVAHVGFEQVLD